MRSRSASRAGLGLVVGLLGLTVAAPSPARAATPQECEAVVKRIGEAAAGLARVNPALREGKPEVLEAAGRTVEAAGVELGKLQVTSEPVRKVARELGQVFGRLGRSLRDLANAVRAASGKTRAKIHNEFRLLQEEMLRHIRDLKQQCQPPPEVPA